MRAAGEGKGKGKGKQWGLVGTESWFTIHPLLLLMRYPFP